MNYAKKILELEVKKLEKSLKEFEDANWERGVKLTKHKIKQVKKAIETFIKE
jgi:exonuclease VII small subunit